jgi:hypothetical protein
MSQVEVQASIGINAAEAYYDMIVLRFMLDKGIVKMQALIEQ